MNEINNNEDNNNFFLHKDMNENFLINRFNQNHKEKPFYLMTLEDNFGEYKQIKIYENSDPFEISYNFCKENNLDYESMKYITKNIKETIKRFRDKKKNDLYFINNDSIFELVDEENYLKDSEILKEPNTEIKKNKSANKLIHSLTKRKIKFNHLNINGEAPLQKKINEQIKKISNIKKNDFICNHEIIMKKNLNKRNSNLNRKNLYESNNIYKTLKPSELSINRNKFIKSEKNWNVGNKRMITFRPSIESFEYGVPVLKNTDNLNMSKYFEKDFKKNQYDIDDDNEKNKSITRKYENEDDDDEEENEISSNKEKITDIKINFKNVNYNQNVKKNNSFHLNRNIRNINNNNYSYNYNYHINNNNNININNNNNNIFTTLDSLTYNNDQHQINYLKTNILIENNINNLNYKSMKLKKFIIDNQTKRDKNFNKKEKDNKKKINSRKNLNSILFTSECKNVLHLIKNLNKKIKMRKTEHVSNDNSKNSFKSFSKKIKNLANEYQNNKKFNSKKIKKNSNNNKLCNKKYIFKNYISPTTKSSSIEEENNMHHKRAKQFFYNFMNNESIKFDSEIINYDDINKAISYSSRNKLSPTKNKKKENKSVSESNYFKNNKLINIASNKKIMLNQKLKLNLRKTENLKNSHRNIRLKQIIKERFEHPHSRKLNLLKDSINLRNSLISYLTYSPKNEKKKIYYKHFKLKKNNTFALDTHNSQKIDKTPKYFNNINLYDNKYNLKFKTRTPNINNKSNQSILNSNNKKERSNFFQSNKENLIYFTKNFSVVDEIKKYFNQEKIKGSFISDSSNSVFTNIHKNNSVIKLNNIKKQILNYILNKMFLYLRDNKLNLINLSKSISDKLKIFPKNIKNLLIKMLNYLNNISNDRSYKTVNKNIFISEMINAYKIILNKKEKKILISNRNEIILLLKQKNIQNTAGPKNYNHFSNCFI